MARFLAPAARGPGWVHATVARRVYCSRLGFARYDLAVAYDDEIHVLRKGWRWVGRRRPPLVEVLDEGWIARPA